MDDAGAGGGNGMVCESITWILSPEDDEFTRNCGFGTRIVFGGEFGVGCGCVACHRILKT